MSTAENTKVTSENSTVNYSKPSQKVLWSEREDSSETKVNQISENNKRYGEWWINNLSRKAQGVISIAKFSDTSTGKRVWAKNAVRIKLYNSLNSLMEEHSLYDILLAHVEKNKEEPFPDVEINAKNQVNNIGTYYISYDIYYFLKKNWNECQKLAPKKDEKE
tara:strand:- start:2387 stop:2875 length:489 start_codon:yes stop_codon:yes gene_type:complete